MKKRRNKAGRSARAGSAPAAKSSDLTQARAHGAAQPRGAAKRAPSSLRSTLARVRLVSLDVDGVMTDGRVVYGPEGRAGELQFFHVQDGIAIEWLRQHGIHVAWITGRGSRTTQVRAAELGVRELHLRVKDKRAVLEDVQRRLGVGADETLVMGDDLPDLVQHSACALFVAPSNAVPEVRAAAHLVTRAAGGNGAVRELVRALLEARGQWRALVARSLR